jgi:hypothetical protein
MVLTLLRQGLTRQVRYFSSSQCAIHRTTKVEELNHLVFVYSFGIHDYLLDNAAVSRCTARTSDKYPMVVANGLPYILDFKGYGNQVRGTLYKVGTKTLADLEKDFNSLSHEYTRAMIPVETEGGQAQPTQAHCFIRTEFPPEFLSYEWKEEFFTLQCPQHQSAPLMGPDNGIKNGPNAILSDMLSSNVHCSPQAELLQMFSQSFHFAK